MGTPTHGAVDRGYFDRRGDWAAADEWPMAYNDNDDGCLYGCGEYGIWCPNCTIDLDEELRKEIKEGKQYPITFFFTPIQKQ